MIEADASNASYFLAAAAVTGGTVDDRKPVVLVHPGRRRFADVLERMGCAVTRGETITVTGPERLRGIEANMEAIPDMAQTLAVVAAFADGPSHITGLASLRVKETDRVAAIAKELPKLGVRVEEGRDRGPSTRLANSATRARPLTPTTTTAWRCLCRRRPACAGRRHQQSWLRGEDVSRLLGAVGKGVRP